MRRRIAVFAFLVPALLAAFALAFVFLQDPDRYREDLAALLSEAAGHPVELRGRLALSWRPTPTLTAYDLHVTTPGARIAVDEVRVQVESSALLARRLRARQVVAQGVRVDFTGAPLAGAIAVLPDPAALPVDRLEIENLELRSDGSPPVRVRLLMLGEQGHVDGPRLRVDMTSPRIHGEARLTRRGAEVELAQIDVETAAGRVAGKLTLGMSGPRPRLSGKLAANALRVPLATGGSGLLIPDLPLAPSLLSRLDVALETRVGRLAIGDLRLSGLEMPIAVRAGELEMRGSGELAQGLVNARLDVSPRGSGSGLQFALELTVADADAGSTLIMLGLHGAERGGRASARVRLNAAGDGREELLASLAGEVVVDARDLTLRASAAELAGSDLFGVLMRSLRGDSDRRVKLECAVGRFAVRDGVLASDSGIGAQSRATNVLGGGRISLVGERMDLLLRPWSREGLGLSATAVVGSIGISGPLRSPQVALTGEALWRSGATASAAVFTSGLSLIAQGLLEHARGDAPCAQAAGTRARGESVPGRVGREVQGAVRGIGRTLRGIFGTAGSSHEGGGRADR